MSLDSERAANELRRVASRAYEWAAARKAFLVLPPGSPDAKAALQRLANAEDALTRSIEP